MSPVSRWVSNKWSGAILLVHMVRLLSNWREVWMCKRRKQPLPPLKFRNGLILNHGAYDDPLLLLDEIFIKRLYDLKARPPRDGVMVDIGANIGAVVEFFGFAHPTLRIHAYEPNPSSFQMLQQNVQDNHLARTVTAFPEAVGRNVGHLSLWVNVSSVLSTAYADAAPDAGGSKVSVPMISLDEVCRRLEGSPIWFLKIDTEGAEGDILEGASTSSLAAVQHAIVEYHDNIVPGVSARCRRVLEAAGFRCHTFVHPWEEGIIYASR